MNVSLYNEIDPFASRWLAQLIEHEHVALGEVDDRSIRDLKGSDLDGRTQVHMFAGIGGWSYALRLAGWPDDRPVWTGSCPCQPFSSAGKKRGEEDERHLWPEMVRLVAECRPPTIFGEQVASDDGRLWLAGVRTDLEALGYAFGAADLCAASVGAPHIRQRLYWVAAAQGEQLDGSGDARGGRGELADGGDVGGVAESENGVRRLDVGATRSAEAARVRDAQGQDCGRASEQDGRSCDSGAARGLANIRRPSDERWMRPDEARSSASQDEREARERERRWLDPWGGGVLIDCADGKARRVGPGVFPLAHGVPARVGRLRAYGNAIVPQVAARFIEAVMAS